MSMQLKPDFVFNHEAHTPHADKARPVAQRTMAAAPPKATDKLGPLTLLPGTWTGKGFNTIWRPFHGQDRQPPQGHFLELNLMQETLQFEEIQGAIPNRGLLQADIDMFGVHYMQQIKDKNTGEGLHFEPGIWLNIPATTNPRVSATVARLGSIPHGTSILGQGTALVVPGPPVFQPVSITPFEIGNPSKTISFPESDLSKPTEFRSKPEAITGITQEMVNNPNSVLQNDIAGQTITRTVVLTVTSLSTPVPGGGTANTAFLKGAPGRAPNADAVQFTAIFWIETVKGQEGQPDFLQLQYTQTVMLDFGGLSWPHVTVATLRLDTPGTP
jgi:hypothetical protein